MDAKDWERLKAKAVAALEKAVDEGRGADAKALYDVLIAVESKGHSARFSEAQAQRMNALGRGP